jgi:hypothetical protein
MDYVNVIGDLGERSVERWFLSRQITAYIVQYEPFDLIVYHNDIKYLIQVKTTTKSRWTIGRSRNHKTGQDKYENTVDLLAFVVLNNDRQDDIYFVPPNEVTSSRPRISSVNVEQKGDDGWNKFLSSQQKAGRQQSLSTIQVYRKTALTLAFGNLTKLMTGLTGTLERYLNRLSARSLLTV